MLPEVISYDKQMMELLVRFFSKGQISFGFAMVDLFFKKQWICNRIQELGVMEGMNSMRQRRCKSFTTATYLKYQKKENELRQASGYLTAKLLMLGFEPKPYPEDSWVLAVNMTSHIEVAYVYDTQEEAESHWNDVKSSDFLVCSLKEAKKRGFARTKPIKMVQAK